MTTRSPKAVTVTVPTLESAESRVAEARKAVAVADGEVFVARTALEEAEAAVTRSYADLAAADDPTRIDTDAPRTAARRAQDVLASRQTRADAARRSLAEAESSARPLRVEKALAEQATAQQAVEVAAQALMDAYAPLIAVGEVLSRLGVGEPDRVARARLRKLEQWARNALGWESGDHVEKAARQAEHRAHVEAQAEATRKAWEQAERAEAERLVADAELARRQTADRFARQQAARQNPAPVEAVSA